MDVISGAMEGIRIKRSSVRFDLDPSIKYQSKNTTQSKDIYNKLDTLALITDKHNISKEKFIKIAKINYRLQKEKEKHKPPIDNTENISQEDEQEYIEGQEWIEGFHDPPMSLIDVPVILQNYKGLAITLKIIDR